MTQIKKMKNKLTPLLLTLLLIVQMFLPVQVFLDPPRVEMREALAATINVAAGSYAEKFASFS